MIKTYPWSHLLVGVCKTAGKKAYIQRRGLTRLFSIMNVAYEARCGGVWRFLGKLGVLICFDFV